MFARQFGRKLTDSYLFVFNFPLYLDVDSIDKFRNVLDGFKKIYEK